jgi:23S rRNA (guanosine2251-2'-O)-methyltransferase
VARETNIAQVLDILKKEGIWIVGSMVQGGRAPWDTDLTGSICLVLGGEGPGLRPLVAKACDFLVSIPMRGRIESLNVGAAAAILCYEVRRQRFRKPDKSS